MIILTKLSGENIVVNSEEIETIETTHDTVITFRSGKKLKVKETDKRIIELAVEYKKEIHTVTK